MSRKQGKILPRRESSSSQNPHTDPKMKLIWQTFLLFIPTDAFLFTLGSPPPAPHTCIRYSKSTFLYEPPDLFSTMAHVAWSRLPALEPPSSRKLQQEATVLLYGQGKEGRGMRRVFGYCRLYQLCHVVWMTHCRSDTGLDSASSATCRHPAASTGPLVLTASPQLTVEKEGKERLSVWPHVWKSTNVQHPSVFGKGNKPRFPEERYAALVFS